MKILIIFQSFAFGKFYAICMLLKHFHNDIKVKRKETTHNASLFKKYLQRAVKFPFCIIKNCAVIH